MKAVVVVSPFFFRDVGDDKVELVIPGATPGEIAKVEEGLVALLKDERADMVLTIPEAPKVQVISAEKVKGVVAA